MTQIGEAYPSSDTVLTSTVISEKRPDIGSSEFTVPDNQPRKIELPSLRVEAFIQRVGVTSANEMATPDNIFFAGWYIDSAVPGETGVSIINGHAGGRYVNGAFRHLNVLESGDLVRVQMGDLSWREFEVVSVDTYDLEQATAALYDDDKDIDRELRLITCDGVFDDITQTYDKRVIVVAKLLD